MDGVLAELERVYGRGARVPSSELRRIFASLGFNDGEVTALFVAAAAKNLLGASDGYVNCNLFLGWLDAVQERNFKVQAVDLSGAAVAHVEVAPGASLQELHRLVGEASGLRDFRLLLGTSELTGRGSVMSSGVRSGAVLTVVKQAPELLLMWNDSRISWTHQLPRSRRVAQLVVGPYTAFALLDDGTAWRVGPRSCDEEDRPLPEPQPLTLLRNACGGPIERLGIDYMTLFAISGGRVWIEDRPGEDVGGNPLCARALCRDGPGEDGGDAGPKLADRLADIDVASIGGDQSGGIVVARTGQSLVYAVMHSDFLFEDVEYEAPFLETLQLPEVRQAVVASCSCALLTRGGHVVVPPFRFEADRWTASQVPGLEDVVELSADARLALDRHGQLWTLEPARVPLLGGGRVERFAGSMAVVRGASGREDAYATENGEVAVRWLSGCAAVVHAQSGRYYGLAAFSGQPPSESPTAAELEGEAALRGAANMLAYASGRFEELRREEGCDLQRLRALLQAGCSGRTWFGQPLLYAICDRRPPCAEADEPAGSDAAFEAALKLLVEHLTDADAAAAVAHAVDTEKSQVLETLARAGCPVTEEDRSRCVETEGTD